MPIENRDLTAGMVLKARHKGTEHTCEVVKTKDGPRYRLRNGKEFSSPSSAGMHITGGVAVNGWRFWSLDGDLKPPSANSEKPKKARARKTAKNKRKKAAKKKVARAAAKGVSYGCGACGKTFPTMRKATAHALTHTTA